MSDRLNANSGFGYIESFGNRTKALGSDFQEDSTRKVADAASLESNPRTFGDDKFGRRMNPERYKPGTVTDLLSASADLGKSIAELGDAIAKYAREMQKGEDDNEQRHKSV